MRSSAVIAALFAVACGRVGFDKLGGAADAATIDDFDDLGEFGAGTLVTALSNPASIDAHPSLTSDRLELYFSSDRGGQSDIWRSTRPNTGADWGTPTRVDELSTSDDEDSPELSADGLEIWIASRRPGGLGDYDIWTSTRPSRTSPWSEPVIVGELNSGDSDHSPAVDAQGLTMVLTSRRSGGAGARDLYMATRSSIGGSWTPPVWLGDINTSGQDADAFLDPSGRFLLFSSDRDSGNFRDLYIAERPDRFATFSTPRLLDDLNSERADADPWVSPDLRNIVFSSSRTGDDEIFEASR